MSAGGAPDDEAGSDNSLLNLVLRNGAFHLSHEDAGCFLAHSFAPLLDRSQHGVAGDGPLSVGETADTHVLGHPKSQPLGRVQYADSRVVIHREERVRARLDSQYVGRYDLGGGQIVAIAYQMLIGRSEEHTSELQSRQYLVCRLLLE